MQKNTESQSPDICRTHESDNENNLEDKQDQHSPTANLNASDIDSEMIKKLRGDAIGDTLYSESFVVKTLLRLSDPIDWSEQLEEDLCFLWDSTLEKDVCNFLLQLSYPNIACRIVVTNEEPRLTEILIGIIANICCIVDDCSVINNDVIESILTLISNDDPLILIQVARFIKGFSYKCKKLHFVTETLFNQICFILLNSTNSELIFNVIEALSRITVYDKVDITLLESVAGELIKSSCISYQTLCKSDENPRDMRCFTYIVQIVSNIATYINECSNAALVIIVKDNISVFLSELKHIFSFYSDIHNLLPLEQELIHIVDAIAYVFQILCIEYCNGYFKSVLTITRHLIENDWEDIEAFLELLCYFIFAGNKDEVKNQFDQFPRADRLLVLNKLRTNDTDYQFDYKSKLNIIYNEYVTTD